MQHVCPNCGHCPTCGRPRRPWIVPTPLPWASPRPYVYPTLSKYRNDSVSGAVKQARDFINS